MTAKEQIAELEAAAETQAKRIADLEQQLAAAEAELATPCTICGKQRRDTP